MTGHDPAGDPVETLGTSLDQLTALVEEVGPDEWTLPTPCEAWDVRALHDHTLASVGNYTAAARGEPRPPAPEGSAQPSGPALAAALSDAAADLVAAWREPGALERPVVFGARELPAEWRVGQQTVEFTVHAWDLARAVGRTNGLDAALADLSLEWGRRNLLPELRGAAFGPEVAPPDGAGPYERLAAFFGRAAG